MPFKSDYKMSNGWGDAIQWSDVKQFNERPLAKDQLYDVIGWKSRRPKVGQTLLAEFENSWMLFEFAEVKYIQDPHDMFFAKVKPIKQEIKK